MSSVSIIVRVHRSWFKNLYFYIKISYYVIDHYIKNILIMKIYTKYFRKKTWSNVIDSCLELVLVTKVKSLFDFWLILWLIPKNYAIFISTKTKNVFGIFLSYIMSPSIPLTSMQTKTISSTFSLFLFVSENTQRMKVY